MYEQFMCEKWMDENSVERRNDGTKKYQDEEMFEQKTACTRKSLTEKCRTQKNNETKKCGMKNFERKTVRPKNA